MPETNTQASVSPAGAATSMAAPQNLGKVSKAERKAQNKTPFLVLAVKYLALLVLMVDVLVFLWLKVDLSESNAILSLVGTEQNTGQRYEAYVQQKQNLQLEKAQLSGKIKRLKNKVETKDYTRYGEITSQIEAEQLQWFDETDEEEHLILGVLDAPKRIQDYFNSTDYKNTYLSGNDITVSGISATRENLNFRTEASNIYGKVFFLNVEFVEMLNAHPRVKNGDLKVFSRAQDEEESDSMSFSLRFDIQAEDEEDAADSRFEDYDQWFSNVLAQ